LQGLSRKVAEWQQPYTPVLAAADEDWHGCAINL
jgi:hypothetical protein